MPQQDLPLCFGPDAPAAWDALPLQDRSRRGRLTEDLCTIDGQHFFIRGRLEIPIYDGDQPFVWLAWSSPVGERPGFELEPTDWPSSSARGSAGSACTRSCTA